MGGGVLPSVPAQLRTILLSKLRRLVVPSVLRTCRRTVPVRFIVKEAVLSAILLVVTVLPTLA